MMYINGRYYTEQELRDVVERSNKGSDVDSVLLSAAIGAITGSSVVGGLLGGSFLGGFLGDVLEGTDDSWF